MAELSTPTIIFIFIARVLYFLLNLFASFGFSSDIKSGEFEIMTLILVIIIALPSFFLIRFIFSKKKNRVTDYAIISSSIIIGLLMGFSYTAE